MYVQEGKRPEKSGGKKREGALFLSHQAGVVDAEGPWVHPCWHEVFWRQAKVNCSSQQQTPQPSGVQSGDLACTQRARLASV